MGHLLGLIVERNRPVTGLMISALVMYLGAKDAGPGFYGLAQDLGELPRGASADTKWEFWVNQLKALYAYYSAKRLGHQALYSRTTPTTPANAEGCFQP